MNHTKKTLAGKAIVVAVTVLVVVAFQFPVLARISEQNTAMSRPNDGYESDTLSFNSEELTAIAAQYDDVEELTGDALIAHTKRVDDIINNTTLSEEEKTQILNDLGVYRVDEGLEVELASSSGNVTLNKPTLSYDSSTKQYIFSGTGYWNSTSAWQNDVANAMYWFMVQPWNWAVGKTCNIGGADVVGICISNPSGSTSGLVANSGYGTLQSSGSTKSITLITNNDNYGVAFQPQDRCIITYYSETWVGASCFRDYTYNYNAIRFQTIVRYNSSLANYNGRAKTFYAHNWENTTISGVGFTDSNVSVYFSQDKYSWSGAFSAGLVF